MAQPTRPTQRPRTAPTPRTTTTTRTQRSTSTAGGKPRPFNMPFESKNVNIVLIGVAVIALGYFLMGSGDALGTLSLGISPWILILGYLVIVPLGILYGARRMKNVREAKAAEAEQASTAS